MPHEKRPLRVRSLFVRISLALVLILSVLGAAQILAFRYLWPRLLDESEQVLNANIAEEIAVQLRPLLKGTIDFGGLYAVLRQLQSLNSRIEVYVLDQSGEVIAFDGERAQLEQPRVNIERIKDFLQSGTAARFPVYGDNPRKRSRPVVFSAAPIPVAESRGYLYVTFLGNQQPFVLAALQARTMPVVIIGSFLLMLLLAASAGVLALFFLTRRFEKLAHVLKRFQGGEYSMRVNDTTGDEIATLGTAFDQMADTIVASMQAIKEQDELRRQLVQNISHDLRGPLTSIAGYLETLDQTGSKLSEPERAGMLHVVASNVEHLRELIDELFELSKLEARERVPEKRIFALDELAAAVITKFEPLAEERTVGLKLILARQEPVLVEADVSMLSRAISNLVENAILYSRPGGAVEISICESSGRVTFAVQDSGIGIAPEEQDKVFSRFYRGEQARAAQIRGSGLGLAIVQKVLELHDTVIHLQSEAGAGSKFSFVLPAAVSPASEQGAALAQ